RHRGHLHSFPTRRSSDLGSTTGQATGGSESGSGGKQNEFMPTAFVPPANMPADLPEVVRMGGYSADSAELRIRDAFRAGYRALKDRKSTRLNSSHVKISY